MCIISYNWILLDYRKKMKKMIYKLIIYEIYVFIYMSVTKFIKKVNILTENCDIT